MQLQIRAILALGLGLAPNAVRAETGQGSSFQEVWDTVASDPYEKPYERVSVTKFFRWGANRLFDSAKRTLNNDADLLPRFDKLLHANGICVKGEWVIDGDSRYTGYFAQGARGLFIGRASVALSDTTRGSYRAFGLAGKIFPTLDASEPVKTANFFTIEDLGGSLTASFLDAPMTNEPPVGVNPSTVFAAPIAAAAATNFGLADKNPGLRQVYPISELGLENPTTAITPRWMRIQGVPGTTRLDEADFRDELDVSRFPEQQVEFEIAVAAPTTRGGSKEWETIGRIILDESVISDSCDHRLHFAHPKFRDDLNY